MPDVTSTHAAAKKAKSGLTAWTSRAFALCLCVVASITGCGEARGSGDPSRGDPSSPRKIVYWEKWTGFEGEAMGRVVSLFNERQRDKAKREPGYRPIEVRQVTISKIEQ